MDMDEKLTLKKFGGFIDDFLKKSDVGILIELPKGTLDAEVKDNINLGGVMQFYIFLHAFLAIFKRMLEELKEDNFEIDPDKLEGFLDGILKMLKNEALCKIRD